MITPNDTVRVLAEALPYIQRFQQAVVIIKYGGSAMMDKTLKSSFARDVVLLKAVGMHPIIVHGGGPYISRRLEERGLPSQFVRGIRLTDRQTMTQVAAVLSEVNAEISQLIGAHGGRAVGLNPDRGMIRARKFRHPDDATDYGFAGEPAGVAPELAQIATHEQSIVVLSPVGIGVEDGLPYNINADLSAAGVAMALRAKKLILMTNTAGVLDENGELITNITAQVMSGMVDGGIISGGMLPKVRCAFDAVRDGVDAVHIIDGRVRNAVLLELLTDVGVGTLVTDQPPVASSAHAVR